MSNLNRAELRARKRLYWQTEKEKQIDKALGSSLVDIEALRRHAVSMGGLFHADIRKKVWPKLVGVNMYNIKPYEGAPLMNHKDRAQVLLDVNRCSRRIPDHYSAAKSKEIQEKLLRVILRTLSEHSDLYYYQGFHDIVITFLLVGGEDFAYAIVNVLVQYHIRDFMDADMNRTKMTISYLRPLLRLESPQLERFIHKSECAYYFSLSWLITWFGHVTRRADEAFRLFDFFLASHPLMPIYLSGAIILSRESEVLALDCEMSAVHGLLSKIPGSLSYEQVIVMAQQLYEKHSPRKLARNEGLKLNTSTLISTYKHFTRHTQHQHTDHLLSRGILPPAPPRWWLDWLPSPSFSLALRLLAIMTPVLLAVIVYWIKYHYTRNSSIKSFVNSARSVPI